MRGRILFVVGLGAGYVLGAKAGRQRYEQIASAADKVWNSPSVAKQRHEVQHFVETKAPKLVETAKDAAGDAVSKVKSRKDGRRGGHSSEVARPEDV
ncbi:hypothetical protein [Agrococcus sp. DT81.2]|uniref:hypothetical protein n=1 Tax=Agrococcus sp. DT81.2 TaxID=3393414 RepID=UPI003CE47C58